MRLFFLLSILGSSLFLSAQTREITYEYDANGNRITRFMVSLRMAQNGSGPSQNIQNTDAFDEDKGVLAILDNTRFTVYPNPTTSVIRAEWQMEDGDYVPIKDVRLLGLNGKIVHEFSQPMLPLDIDMQSLPNGTYILWIMPEEGEVQRVKVVKQ